MKRPIPHTFHPHPLKPNECELCGNRRQAHKGEDE